MYYYRCMLQMCSGLFWKSPGAWRIMYINWPSALGYINLLISSSIANRGHLIMPTTVVVHANTILCSYRRRLWVWFAWSWSWSQVRSRYWSVHVQGTCGHFVSSWNLCCVSNLYALNLAVASSRCRTICCVWQANVEGMQCDKCKEGTFGLDASNAAGCTECYCSGLTSKCTTATVYMSTVSSLQRIAVL